MRIPNNIYRQESRYIFFFLKSEHIDFLQYFCLFQRSVGCCDRSFFTVDCTYTIFCVRHMSQLIFTLCSSMDCNMCFLVYLRHKYHIYWIWFEDVKTCCVCEFKYFDLVWLFVDRVVDIFWFHLSLINISHDWLAYGATRGIDSAYLCLCLFGRTSQQAINQY